MKTFKPLYCLDKAGSVRIFTLEVLYRNGIFLINSSTGLIGGKLTTTTKKVTKGKNIGKANETSAHDQALKDAESLWNAKLLEGYKSQQTLLERITSLGNTVEPDIDIVELFKQAEVRFNSTPQWYPLPMLANRYSDLKQKVKFPALLQPKLNGVRCLATYDRDIDEVVLYGRSGEIYEIGYIKSLLYPLLTHNQNIVLDGEIYKMGKRLQEINGAACRKKDMPDWLEYHIYDMIIPQVFQRDRLTLSANLYSQHVSSIDNKGKINLVNTIEVQHHDEIKIWHDAYVSNGYEGVILRNPNTFYEIGFRSNNLLKVKSYIDEEFELTDCECDPNKTIGSSFVFIVKDNIQDNITFKARPTGTEAQKIKWWNNRSWIGSTVTVRFQERSLEGIPLQGHVVYKDCKILTTIADE